nr:MAG TPA: hypothetical protein [Bacteriophage sp.]
MLVIINQKRGLYLESPQKIEFPFNYHDYNSRFTTFNKYSLLLRLL